MYKYIQWKKILKRKAAYAVSRKDGIRLFSTVIDFKRRESLSISAREFVH